MSFMTSGQTPPSPFAAHLREKGVLVVFNPRSGGGDNSLTELLYLLRAYGIPLTERSLEGTRPIADFVTDASDYAAVIAAGGDGTVSGLAYALAQCHCAVPVLAFPAGTANLIAVNLGIPAGAREQLLLLLSGQTAPLDLGELQTQGHPPRGFAMLAGTGLDAHMIRESETYKRQLGTFSYVLAALRQVNPPATTFHICVDGGPVQHLRGIGLMLANLGHANLRLPITADISPSDGLFTVIVLRRGNVLQLLPSVLDSLLRRFRLHDLAQRRLETFTARELEVWADDPFPLQFDGELHPQTTPFRARVLPRAVHFFTPLGEHDLNT